MNTLLIVSKKQGFKYMLCFNIFWRVWERW